MGGAGEEETGGRRRGRRMRLKMSVERESDRVRRRNYPYSWGYMHNFASPKKSKEGEKNHAHSIDENFSHRNCVADKKMWDSAEGHFLPTAYFRRFSDFCDVAFSRQLAGSPELSPWHSIQGAKRHKNNTCKFRVIWPKKSILHLFTPSR